MDAILTAAKEQGLTMKQLVCKALTNAGIPVAQVDLEDRTPRRRTSAASWVDRSFGGYSLDQVEALPIRQTMRNDPARIIWGYRQPFRWGLEAVWVGRYV